MAGPARHQMIRDVRASDLGASDLGASDLLAKDATTRHGRAANGDTSVFIYRSSGCCLWAPGMLTIPGHTAMIGRNQLTKRQSDFLNLQSGQATDRSKLKRRQGRPHHPLIPTPTLSYNKLYANTFFSVALLNFYTYLFCQRIVIHFCALTQLVQSSHTMPSYR